MSILAWLVLHVAVASDRYVRVWTEDDGLPVRKVLDVAQDDAGWLWLGTAAGLVRYDGARFVPFAGDLLPEQVQVVVTGQGDLLLAAGRDGPLVDLTDRAHPTGVRGPDGAPLDGVIDVAIDGRGDVWVVTPTGLLRRTAAGWDAPLDGRLDADEEVRRVRATPGSATVVLTDRAVWVMADDGVRRLPVPSVSDAVVHADGRAVLVHWDGTVDVVDGAHRTTLSPGAFARTVVLRGDVAWVGVDDALVGLRPGSVPDRIPLARRLGGPMDLLVDREGSLWMAGSHGLLQFPEPETLTLTEDDGLPSDLVDRVLPVDGGVWAVTRAGLGWAHPGPEGWTAALATPLGKPLDVCVDGSGTAWTSGFVGRTDRRLFDGVLVALDADGERRFDVGLGDDHAACATDPAGRVWLAVAADVWRADVSGPVRAAPGPVGAGVEPRLRVEGARVWWLEVGRACAATTEALGSGDPEWDCVHTGDAHDYTDAWTFSDGTLWLATRRHGVVDRAGRAVDLPTGSGVIRGFAPSGRGGLWVYGQRTALRVDRAEGRVLVLERLGAWHGLVDGSPNDLAEGPDGTVWLATLSGLTRVPPSARVWATAPVPVRLVSMRHDGIALAPGPVTLPHHGNRLELEFAALSYRDPGSLAWRRRVDGGTRPLDGPTVQLLDLAAGHHDLAVEASVDGVTWSPEPARISVTVRQPWYLQGGALAAFGAAIGLALLGAHRMRVAVLLGLERQRARIALDLHDEIGSGLGGIGLLAGVLRDGPSGGPGSLAARVADAAEELGTALTDIVWALRSGSESGAALLEHLEARGRTLFPDPRTRFTVVGPSEWPTVALSLSARRHLQAIAVEALHNAARHAGATHVELGLMPEGRTWRLWVRDDGRGLDAAAPSRPGGGAGLEGMRHRAGHLGARFELASSAAGTTVTVWFDPGAGDRRVR